ncbi:cobalt ECF transporter T component CbiQ [Promethearchaeum syntrophicum]|uniref:Cobalt ECF transporter T component CbiQ n=1 Tax=Promethearchaeum syntrophicum TaxID=2594042 RepID=A0A5B9D9Q4_9ARCH|nr:cobalt ECF transporter T component CbiQ [Candidatus Prometheoarchaeum syntrophicum]QEE15823.1 Energy-coupling factor transporter transmembrane protein EcfT [Candidatus Prometheoarchaeum syntrophicum]
MSFLVRVNENFQDYLNTEYESTQKTRLFYIFPLIKLISTLWMIVVVNYAIKTENAYISYIVISIVLILSATLLKINIKRYIKFLVVLGILFPLIVTIPLLFSSEGLTIWSFNIFSINFTVTQLGFNLARNFLLRILANIAIITFFTLSTPFTHIIHILHQIRFPSVLITIITLTYRYFFLFFENLIKILRADDCRRFEKYAFKKRFTHLGTIFSMLLLRSFNHGTKIHQAMLARCYNGDLPDINYRPKLLNTLIYLLCMILLNTLIWIFFV